jgi:urate oxidase
VVRGGVTRYEKGPLSRENDAAEASIRPDLEGTFSISSSHSPNGLVVAFDDDHAVANAGLVLHATLAERLGIEAVVDRLGRVCKVWVGWFEA